MSRANPFLDPHFPVSEADLIKWYLDFDLLHNKNTLLQSGIPKPILKYRYFKEAVSRIPSYRQFLRDSGWVGNYQINSESDWQKIPPMDKQNYISQHTQNELVLDENLGQAGKIVSLSSGSSGQAFYWPRAGWQEIEGALFHELLLTSLFKINERKTLVVVAFSMGSYLAGTYTYNSVRWVGAKGYDLTVITPGLGETDALSMIAKLAPLYEQVILVGYPPYLKDLLEAGLKLGLNWPAWNTKLLFASELFSETWRDGVAKLAGIKDVLIDTTNIYGASEGTLFGWETKEAIFIRRQAESNKELHLALFGSELTPTLIEYNPSFRYFEVIDGTLYLTAWAGIPLIRYNLKDKGGILTASNRRAILKKFGIDLLTHFKKEELSELPMVYVLGRADSAASIYGVLVYPEYIKLALEQEWERLSGKFSILTQGIGQNNPELIIHVELKRGKKKSLQLTKKIESDIKAVLSHRSREYASLISAVGKKAWPKVVLHSRGDQKYFPTRVKQKWIIQ